MTNSNLGDSTEHAEEVIARAEAVEQRLEDNPTFKNLNSGFARLKIVSTILIFVVVVLAVVVAGLTYTYGKLDRTQETQQDRCELNNRNKAGERELWAFILGIPPTTPQTPTQDANRAKLAEIINRVYAESDCSKPS